MKSFLEYLNEGYRVKSEYLYHLTENLADILASGAILTRGTIGGVGYFGSDLDAHSRGRIHFSADPSSWWDMLGLGGSGPASILRIHRDDANRMGFTPIDPIDVIFLGKPRSDVYKRKSLELDVYTTGKVPVSRLEILNHHTLKWEKTSLIKDIRYYIGDFDLISDEGYQKLFL